MLLGARSPRDLPVRDVPDEQVAERVFAVVRHGRGTFAADELLPLQIVQARLEPGRLETRERAESTEPEALADHGGVVEQRFLLGLEQVEPRRDQALDRLRKL